MKSMLSLLALATFVLPLAGCFDLDLGDSTEGEEGQVEFAYASFDNCLFGCSVEQPMMLGTVESISVNPKEELGGLRAESSHPDVFSVTMTESLSCCTHDGSSSTCASVASESECKDVLEHSYAAEVEAKAQGTAKLVIRTKDGNVLDQVALSIRKPFRFATSCEPDLSSDPELIELSAGTTCNFELKAFDILGTELRAQHGFSIVSDAPAVVILESDAWFHTTDPETGDELNEPHGKLKGKTPGAATITARGGEIEEQIAVKVR